MSLTAGVLVVGLTILVHELGHLVVAKRCHEEIEEFGIGFGPHLVRLFRWKETQFYLNLLPFGGYIKTKREISEMWPAKQWWITLAGPAGNAVAAGIVFGIIVASNTGWLWLPIMILLGIIFSTVGILIVIPLTLVAMTGILGWDFVGGPVTLVSGASDAATSGIRGLSQYFIAVNISLGALNLLPIPIFDGGRLANLLIKKISPLWLKKTIRAAQIVLVILFLHLLLRACIADAKILF